MAPLRKQTRSGERHKFVRRVIPIRSGLSLALSHQRMASTLGLTAPVKAVSRRRRARASASLDGRRLVRQRRSSNHGLLLGDVLSGCPGLRSRGTHCAPRKRRVSAVKRLSTVVESERTLPEPLKTRLHLVLTQCADIDSRADRTSKPCLLLSCYQAVGCLRLAGPALSFAKPPSDKTRPSRTRAGSARI